jgi:hypothetical protein
VSSKGAKDVFSEAASSINPGSRIRGEALAAFANFEPRPGESNSYQTVLFHPEELGIEVVAVAEGMTNLERISAFFGLPENHKKGIMEFVVGYTRFAQQRTILRTSEAMQKHETSARRGAISSVESRRLFRQPNHSLHKR